MCTEIVRDNVAHSFREFHRLPGIKLAHKLSLQAMNNLAVMTPVVGQVSFGILDDPHAEVIKLQGLPESGSGFAFVFGLLNG